MSVIEIRRGVTLLVWEQFDYYILVIGMKAVPCTIDELIACCKAHRKAAKVKLR